MIFDNIKNINVEDASSWTDKIFLTFDTDWCSDEVLSYTLDVVEKYDIAATFFVTHKTPLLDRMRENPEIELGIHPNFNFLLNGDFRYGGNYEEVIKYYMDIVPEAVSVRSHSLVRSSPILIAFSKIGLTHESNIFLPMDLCAIPFVEPITKMTAVPHFFEDDIAFMYGDCKSNVFEFVSADAIKVFAFHPIHILLNTENQARWAAAKHMHSLEELKNSANKKEYGAMDFLMELIRVVSVES